MRYRFEVPKALRHAEHGLVLRAQLCVVLLEAVRDQRGLHQIRGVDHDELRTRWHGDQCTARR